MLAPDDRAVLREQLRPSPGTTFDYGIATTFTLDLTAALVAPLAFAAHHVRQSSDPVAVLEAVRAVTERLDVFCQAGQIRVPKSASDLMAFLEPMVHEVVAPRAGYLFHPKIWIVRYLDLDGEPSYRFVCGTRNLTDDVSWDAVVCLDGHIAGRRPMGGNRPLSELVHALPDLAVRPLAEERRTRVAAVAEELRRVEWEPPEDMRELRFHVLGLAGDRNRPGVLDTLQGRRHLVVSPFLDDEGVAAATSGGTAPVLVSRPEALDRLDPATLAGVDCRIISPLAGLHQPDDETADPASETAEAAETSILGGLHAKIYVIEAARQVRLLLGSANATHAGLEGGNVEFLVEMLGRPKHMAIDHLTGPDADFAAILERYETTGGIPEPPDETLGREIERHLRRLASTPLHAEVAPSGDGWCEQVRGNEDLRLPEHSTLKVRLLTLEGTAVAQNDDRVVADFADIAIADITPFIVLELCADDGTTSVERTTVVRAELVGDPPGRFDEVIARQVDTPEKFLRFLALLLGLGDLATVISGEGTGAGSWSFGQLGSTGVFELLVRAVADRPAAIDDLSRLIDRLQATEQGRAVLPEGFIDLWAAIVEARSRLQDTA